MSTYLETTHRNIIWFKRASESGELQMAPPFQRNPVWTDRQKSYLIDTIMRGFPIPEIYMQDIVDANAKQSHIVVDGQQRIRACLEFLEGKFELDAKESPDLADLTFDDLRPEEKKKLFEYRFVVRLLPETPDPILRNIFQRLNRNNVALNTQELRQATYWGPFIVLMNKLSDDNYWTNTGIFTPNDVRRMLDVEFISELAIGHLHGLQNKKQSLDKWFTAYENEFEQQSYLETVFEKVTGELTQVLPDIIKTRWRKKSDFYTLFLVFAAHSNSLPLSSDKRLIASERLAKFGQQVTDYLREFTVRLPSVDETMDDETGDEEAHSDVQSGAIQKNYPEEVIQYAVAVHRAASDLGNRKRRALQLEKTFADVWETSDS